MIGSRPNSSAFYLERPRLWGSLPDSGGYVVWLQAPYGAGKSVLTAQWVTKLELDGWQSIWLSLRGQDPHAALNAALELPPHAPWPVTLEVLWSVARVVVLEDIEGSEELSPLLSGVAGLVALSSRGELSDPELPRLMTSGALVRLGASDLAFTRSEALALFADEPRAEAAWRACGGWSLPLHISALTHAPIETGTAALLRGIRASLSEAQWQALLLLSGVPQWPVESADEALRGLVSAGFAQAQAGGIALHALLKSGVTEHYSSDRARVALSAGDALPADLRAELFGGSGLLDALEDLLGTQVLSLPSVRVHQLEALLPAPPTPGRALNSAYAFEHDGRYAPMHAALGVVLTHATATAHQRLLAVAKALMYVDRTDPPEPRARLLELANTALERASAEEASQYHLNVSVHFNNSLEWQAARWHLERCLELLPIDHEKRRHYERMVRGRLATIRWGELGDLAGIAVHYSGALEGELPATSRMFYLTYSAFYELLRGQTALARERALAAERLRAADPALALEARALRAFIDGRIEDFAPICAALPDTSYWNGAWTRALWARSLRRSGDPTRALEVLQGYSGTLLECERALALAALGQHSQALEIIAPLEPLERFELLYVCAARYEIGRDPHDLETLLNLTLERERILPFFVALDSLPRERPQLAAPYPLSTVLSSNWREAIKYRHAEIPPLELHVLGRLEVRVCGQVVSLKRRPWEVLVSLLLGQSRPQITESLWPDASPDAGRNNLHVTLNGLRRSLEPWGVTTYLTEDGLRHVDSDLQDVREALKRNDGEALLRLYSGEFAPELEAEALALERQHLQGAVIAALFDCAQTSNAPLPYLERVLELEPLHEPALRAQLVALVRVGRSAQAAQLYRDFEARLSHELALTPQPATRAALETNRLASHVRPSRAE